MTKSPLSDNPTRIDRSPAAASLRCGDRLLDLSSPQVMGILNATPDSFSDGGRFHQGGRLYLDGALKHAEAMLSDGASIIDVGGESTRPGAKPVSEQEELDRVLPIVEALAARLDVIVSVDTSTARVITEASRLGAGMINDVRALTRDGALIAAAQTELPVCLMHMQGQPGSMQDRPEYQDVLAEVDAFLLERVKVCEEAGIASDRVLLDPGFGFGKTAAHNLQLLKELKRLKRRGFPILVGLSRKSLIGHVLGRDTAERLPASLSLAIYAMQQGADIIRCHDVKETVDALTMWRAVDHWQHAEEGRAAEE